MWESFRALIDKISFTRRKKQSLRREISIVSNDTYVEEEEQKEENKHDVTTDVKFSVHQLPQSTCQTEVPEMNVLGDTNLTQMILWWRNVSSCIVDCNDEDKYEKE